MRGTIYVVRLGEDIMPHFRLRGESYVVPPGVEILFEISEEAEPEKLLAVLSKKALEEAKRLGIRVNPLDFK